MQSIKTDTRWQELMQKLDLILNPPIADHSPQRRAHHEMVYDDGNKSIILSGGSTPLNGGQSFKFFNDIWRYNQAGWSRAGTAGEEHLT
ncbi:MAG: kelch repeat-containing protein [Saprospiraceae bacterium]